MSAQPGDTITSLRMSAVTSPDSSATPAPIIAPIISPTAVKLMKFGISDEYMKRMPSAFSRLRISVVDDLDLVGLGVDALERDRRAEERQSTADSTITMAIRIRKMTTGCGTMFPTRSTPSRNRCITVFGGRSALNRQPSPPPRVPSNSP